MRWNKKTARTMLTILVVALVGMEVRQAVDNAMNEYKKRPDVIRRFGRVRARKEAGIKSSGFGFDDDWEDTTLEC